MVTTTSLTQLPVGVSVTERRPGFRLERLEVYNWGTLHRKVWGLNCHGDNTLLTGDIGSGKSTLVDAISTLLIAPQKITYNKAAGADARERTPRTYVLGYYKSERGDAGSAAKPIALRDYRQYSVVLARFQNEPLSQQVTLAQVFWWKNPQGQPARFYMVADGALSITEHFANFGKDVERLRKRLRGSPGVELFDSFPPFGAAYRRRLGIESEQAMDLFYQTVSMKSVGSLTVFVRLHMLEPFTVDERIGLLIQHFDDLTRAHGAVQKARQQIDRLTPLVTDCAQRAELAAHADVLRACREALAPWFAQLKGTLLEHRLARQATDAARLAEQLDALKRRERDETERCDELTKNLAARGGDRLDAIGRAIAKANEERATRAKKAERYAELAKAAGLSPIPDAESFHEQWAAAVGLAEEIEGSVADVQNEMTEATVLFKALNAKHDDLRRELDSLRRRRSNIPARILAIRDRMCEALALDTGSLPFAGELIQVRESARDWEGVIERLLHGFALSVLVPDAQYGRVATWVDRHHLGDRLVYLRTRDTGVASSTAAIAGSDAQAVWQKVQIEPRSPFYAWLERTLSRRFDHTCCASIDDLRRADRGVTRSGQIKHGDDRHEKDDRHPIDDRTRWVLGWSNERKIAVLEQQERELAAQGQACVHRLEVLKSKQKALGERKRTLDQLAMFENFQELDWQAMTLEVQRLEVDRQMIEQSSDLLRTLREQQQSAMEVLAHTREEREARASDHAVLLDRMRQDRVEVGECTTEVAAVSEAVRNAYFPRLEAMRDEAVGSRTLTVETCQARHAEMRDWLQKRIDADGAKLKGLDERIVKAMQSYMRDYPLETREVDAEMESAVEFGAMLERLRADDLPRFEDQFKQLLNVNTIREVANFQSQLHRERETILQRIERINESLRDIPYNPGRFIQLEAVATGDQEIRDFQHELRSCTEGTLHGAEDDAYSEAKFLQVKRIIERFSGREGVAEADRKWTAKVTDVRNWYEFSASERWKEDGQEYEHYTDSGGKSGGQKEKLAYTVLAASLAYQFGLDAGRPRTFRFAVIDEAFGRGSDDSTQYGLELFRKLDLQLLVVTPLQKIHVIEPYVAAVGFVHNPDGQASMLRNLTIEEYRAERAARGAAAVDTAVARAT